MTASADGAHGASRRQQTLAEWLESIERLHPRQIELGLERVREVARALDLLSPSAPVITIAGTNGKGTTAACLQALLTECGYRTGVYTSPHLIDYNERIAVAGEAVDDTAICRAFEEVEAARGDIMLTYFEFGTLAALQVFRACGCDVLVLEVGLGGRLDAVNIIDADIAILTSIALDHQQWLGDSREQIGHEKAGIVRRGRPALCADPEPPESILAVAEQGVELRRIGVDFNIGGNDGRQDFWSQAGVTYRVDQLPSLQLAPESVAVAIEAARLLVGALRPQAVRRALAAVRLRGRFERHRLGTHEVVVDVAHNPAAAMRLTRTLGCYQGRTWVLLGMLRDKDCVGFTRVLAPVVDGGWILCGLPGPRGGDPAALVSAVGACSMQPVLTAPSVADGWSRALAAMAAGDRLVVTGSFITVGETLKILARASGD